MKSSIMKIALGALLLCAAPATFAQTDATTGATSQAYNLKKKAKLTVAQKAKHQTAHLTKQLGLTKAQQAKVQAINTKYAKLKPSKEMFVKKEAEIESVLTAEQKVKFAAIKKKYINSAK